MSGRVGAWLRSDGGGAVLAVVVGVLLAVPFGLRHDLAGAEDLATHASLLESQHVAWQELGRPSPFVAPLGGGEHFSPAPAVYGGAAYAVLALARFAVSLPAVLVLAVAVGWVATSWGLYRLARAAGSPPLVAAGLAAAVVGSGQVLATAYARLALLEILGWGAVVAAAGSVAVLRSDGARRRPGAVAIGLLAGAGLGAHLLTLTWAAVATVAVAAVAVASARPTLASLRRTAVAGVPVALGVLATAWQWPVVVAVFSGTIVDDPQQYVASGWFAAPFGQGSGPDLWRELDPLRPPVGTGALIPYRTTLPVLLGAWTVAVAWSVRGQGALRPIRSVAVAVGAVGVVAVLAQRVPMVVDVVWPLATMQYHWRLLTYVAVAIAGLALLVAGRVARTGHWRPWMGQALALLVAFELLMGMGQAVGSGDPAARGGVGPASVSAVSDDPMPWIASNKELLRATDLPVLDGAVPAATVVGGGDDPEAPLRARPPAGAARFTVPVVAASPFTVVTGARAVGWAPRTEPPDTRLDIDANHLLLVVEQDRAATVVVRPGRAAPMGWSVASIGVLTWALLAGSAGCAVAGAIARWRRRGEPASRSRSTA